MKTILYLILGFFGITVGLMFLPAVVGVFIGLIKFDNGNTLGGIASIVIGLLMQGLWMLYIFGLDGVSFGNEDCPYCGSGDTDGNHCYTCDDDF